MRNLANNLQPLAINAATIKQWSLAQLLDGCARRGVTAVTPWRHHVQELGAAKVRRLFADTGVRISGYCRGGFLTNPDAQAAHDENVEALKEAADVGATSMAIVAGGVASDTKDLSVARQRVTERLNKLFEQAKTYKVPLLIEPLHPMYAGDRSCVNTLSQALDMCDAIDPERSKYLGVICDVYHCWWDPYLKAQIYRAGKDRLQAFHVCDWLVPTKDMLNDRGMMGDGVIDIRGIRHWVDEIGFDGIIEVEIFSERLTALPGEDVLALCIERYQTVV